MGVKNLHAAVSEGGYDKLGVNLFTYPYVSVLNQQKINDYYDYQEKTDQMYEYNLEDQQLWMLESQEFWLQFLSHCCFTGCFGSLCRKK
jgi:hypothetical protein